MQQKSRFAVVIAAGLLLAGCHKNHSVYALTNEGQLVQFDTASPGTINSAVTVTPLTTPTSTSTQGVVQMAYDAVSGEVYCITADGYLCILTLSSGDTALVGTVPFTEILGNGGNVVRLSNPAMSFDPVSKDFRVIDPTYNLLVNPTTGELDESKPTLAYDSGDTNKDATPSLAGVAYTNPLSNATSTTLYALDSSTHSLARIGDSNVSNTSSVDTGVMHTVGDTGVTFTDAGGFAIDPGSGDAYAVLQPSGSTPSLYTVDLDNGSVTSEGTLGTVNGNSGTLTIESLLIVP